MGSASWRPSPRRVPLETAQQVLRLYGEKYFDFNVCHFHEKLREQHGIGLSYTWVKLALQGAGLVHKRRRRGLTARQWTSTILNMPPSFDKPPKISPSQAEELAAILEKYSGPDSKLPTREQVEHPAIPDAALRATFREY